MMVLRRLCRRLRYAPFLSQLVVTRRCNLSCAYCTEFDHVSAPVAAEVLRARIDGRLRPYAQVPRLIRRFRRDPVRYREQLLARGESPFRCRAGSRYLYIDQGGIVHFLIIKEALRTRTSHLPAASTQKDVLTC
jgi:hypothetical protein